MQQLSFANKKVPYVDLHVDFTKLAFYPENPRIYSRFAGGNDRTQEAIQNTLAKMDHVRSLRSRIDRDGQVNEPLYCIPVEPDSEFADYDYQVLEGNSRLAALKMHKSGSLPPPTVPCRILDFAGYDESERETLIFSLLGEAHIIGKTEWKSYENAAYIHRRHINQKVSIATIATEIGKGWRTVKNMVDAFDLMMRAKDPKQDNWSYYEAYMTSGKLRKHREDIPDLDQRVTSLIKSGGFPRALDMRDNLADILSNKSARTIFMDEEEPEPFVHAYAIAESRGDTNTTLKRLQQFRRLIAEDDTSQQIRSLLETDKSKGPTQYELNQITRIIERIIQRANL